MPSRNPDPGFDPPLHVIRGHRVILDADLARLYGVPTMRLNEAVKRNADRFPSDFVFQLVPEEWEALIRSPFATGSAPDPMLSQIAMTSPETPEFQEKSLKMWSQTAATSTSTSGQAKRLGRSSRRRATHLPWAFTEHGALMAGTILRSPRAVQMSLYIVRAFVKLRQIALENEHLSRRMLEAEVALREHDVLLTDIYDKLEPLLEPLPDPVPKRSLGFRKPEEP